MTVQSEKVTHFKFNGLVIMVTARFNGKKYSLACVDVYKDMQDVTEELGNEEAINFFDRALIIVHALNNSHNVAIPEEGPIEQF